MIKLTHLIDIIILYLHYNLNLYEKTTFTLQHFYIDDFFGKSKCSDQW